MYVIWCMLTMEVQPFFFRELFPAPGAIRTLSLSLSLEKLADLEKTKTATTYRVSFEPDGPIPWPRYHEFNENHAKKKTKFRRFC